MLKAVLRRRRSEQMRHPHWKYIVIREKNYCKGYEVHACGKTIILTISEEKGQTDTVGSD